MYRPLLLLAAATFLPLEVLAQTSVDVSIGINQPGVYGRVDIGAQPPPPVIYAQPVIAMPVPARVHAEPPLYLYVPPGHQKHWSKHCARYDACGRPVYFVRESWVRERYDESRRGQGDDRGHGKKHKGGHGQDN